MAKPAAASNPMIAEISNPRSPAAKSMTASLSTRSNIEIKNDVISGDKLEVFSAFSVMEDIFLTNQKPITKAAMAIKNFGAKETTASIAALPYFSKSNSMWYIQKFAKYTSFQKRIQQTKTFCKFDYTSKQQK
jgi:hypothetical protein